LLPRPLPVPPAIECKITKPSRDSEPSAYLSIMSMISYWNFYPWANPLAQLLPAPPPSLEMKIFSGLYKFEYWLVWILLMTFLENELLLVQDRPKWNGECNDHHLLGKRRHLFDLRLHDYWRYTPIGFRLGLSRALCKAASKTMLQLNLKQELLWFPHWPIWIVIISRGILSIILQISN